MSSTGNDEFYRKKSGAHLNRCSDPAESCCPPRSRKRTSGVRAVDKTGSFSATHRARAKAQDHLAASRDTVSVNRFLFTPQKDPAKAGRGIRPPKLFMGPRFGFLQHSHCR